MIRAEHDMAGSPKTTPAQISPRLQQLLATAAEVKREGEEIRADGRRVCAMACEIHRRLSEQRRRLQANIDATAERQAQRATTTGPHDSGSMR
ncbi:hypothetical protein [Planobispora takensis]|uniref:Uncharacterized protein n=1 Tax=Planobispora takensis TaxID=1367882 RepID=A0A8J3T7Q9_9ACTN|nr:hypothetical protein [Planobispora takensis]GII05820.1 hypothetical protein Pta02_78280 [Planobispora takensis]